MGGKSKGVCLVKEEKVSKQTEVFLAPKGGGVSVGRILSPPFIDLLYIVLFHTPYSAPYLEEIFILNS